MEQYIFFNGRKYSKTEKGYYICTTIPHPYLHVDIWKATHGEIPKGYEIPHRDFNPSNNALENLQCLSRKEHRQIHNDARRTIPTICVQCGKEFLAVYKAKFCSRRCKRHWLRAHKRFNDHTKKICLVCGKEFETGKYSNAQYCSQKCVVAASKHFNERLTPEQREEIRHLYIPRDSVFGGAALAKKYGVSETTIRRAVKRRD